MQQEASTTRSVPECGDTDADGFAEKEYIEIELPLVETSTKRRGAIGKENFNVTAKR